MTIDIATQSTEALQEIARDLGIADLEDSNRPEIIAQIRRAQAERAGNLYGEGLLELTGEGYGFIRRRGYLPSPDDAYVAQPQVRRLGLRTGDRVAGILRYPRNTERYFALIEADTVNGLPAEGALHRPIFEQLTPVFPHEMYDLEADRKNLTQRLINIVAPIGRGQRGLIVSPPKVGKTTILKDIANGIAHNAPEAHLIVLMIGERPEEVTDVRRSVKAEVVASTFDEPFEDHRIVAELTIERAKRLVELGRDVVILLDSLTRLVRAYNLIVPPSGRTLSGGVDPAALFPPKRFFGAARKQEEGGSLTIIATCLVETGSRMDDVIYEEFKGTGNMEIVLDRKLAEKRIFPAIEVNRSGTRREELLLDAMTMRQVLTVRRMIGMIGGVDGYEAMLERMGRTYSNREFLSTLGKEIV